MKRTLSLLIACLTCTALVLSLAGCPAPAMNVPIVCGETNMSDECGVATYGVDYYSLGLKAGDMAADILLNGQNPATMAVQSDPNPSLILNENIANEIGFTIPQSVKDKAGTAGVVPVTRVEAAYITDAGAADFKIGIIQLVQHGALDAANDGFLDQLSVRLNAASKTAWISNQNASGDEANNATITATFITQNVDLIYSIATSSSQAAAAAAEESNTPVIFNAVTDPVGASLVASMTAPGAHVTGVSDINPVEKQLDLIAELLGKDNPKIGFLYTSSETNSVYQVRTLGIPHCQAEGYTYVERGISDINDLESAMIFLKQQGVDAIYIPTDNTLANGATIVHSKNIGE